MYQVDGVGYRVERRDVVHFRSGIDPHRPHRGVSRAYPILREICGDNEASEFTQAILERMGIAGMVISGATPDMEISPPEVDKLKDWFDNQITGSNRGRPVVLSTPIKIDTPGHSPEALALDKTAARFEARICSALRVPLQVAGLSSSDKSKTYANYEQARAALYYDGLIPLQRRFDATIKHAFDGEYLRPSEMVARNYADVDCLAVDQTEEVKRWDMGVRGGWIKVSEARAARGLPVVPSDEIYLRPSTATVVEEYEEVDPALLPGAVPGALPPGEDDDEEEGSGGTALAVRTGSRQRLAEQDPSEVTAEDVRTARAWVRRHAPASARGLWDAKAEE
jgi:phage portal protein BeeE